LGPDVRGFSHILLQAEGLDFFYYCALGFWLDVYNGEINMLICRCNCDGCAEAATCFHKGLARELKDATGGILQAGTPIGIVVLVPPVRSAEVPCGRSDRRRSTEAVRKN